MRTVSERLHHTLPGFRLRESLSQWWARQPMASPRPLIENYTGLPKVRLKSLERLTRTVVAEKVPGELVECGCARGGSAALMAVCLERLRSEKRIFVFDTFEGLPPPTSDDPASANEWIGGCRGGLDEVRALFDEMGVTGRAFFVKGLFSDTLGAEAPQRIALLHLDADWYESTRTCLETLWDRLSIGGALQVDDYGTWDGCRKAVDQFFADRGITTSKTFLDSGAFWMRKS